MIIKGKTVETNEHVALNIVRFDEFVRSSLDSDIWVEVLVDGETMETSPRCMRKGDIIWTGLL